MAHSDELLVSEPNLNDRKVRPILHLFEHHFPQRVTGLEHLPVKPCA